MESGSAAVATETVGNQPQSDRTEEMFQSLMLKLERQEELIQKRSDKLTALESRNAAMSSG